MTTHTAEIELGITRWCSWLPGQSASVCTASAGGAPRQTLCEQPDPGSIPPMLRRRLGPLARVVFHVLNECVASPTEEAVIFSSRLGEIQRTQGILDALASNAPVSPAAFSLSVHNAIAGLWSLAHEVHLPLLALAPANGSPVPALVEACAQLAERPDSTVIVVCYEESYPEFYAPYLESPTGISAVALRLEQPRKGGSTMALSRCAGNTEGCANGLPGFIDLLHGHIERHEFTDPNCYWLMEITK